MEVKSFTDSAFFVWGLLPFLIFLARICDVSLQTLRITFVSKGWRYLAPIVGFFEVIIWLLAIRAVLQNLNNVVCFIAYAAGFATGSYIGILIEKKLALGRTVLQIVTQKDAAELIEHLIGKGYGLTYIDAHGNRGEVKIIYMIIKRQVIPELTKEIERFNPRAFYTIEDVQFVNAGIFPSELHHWPFGLKKSLGRFWRKGK
ncbi:MAG: DUF2179 domain-containing protein [Candidatus Aminicenantes bacterium]|nr:DUF2179 domain-containing protein [Candidatus Aminicenantes bacterium]